jgi:hypothetical protein
LRYLFGLHNEAIQANLPIELDLSDCRTISHAAISLIYGASRQFAFNYYTAQEKILKKLADHLNWGTNTPHVDPASLHSIPLKFFKTGEEVIDYLDQHWLGPGWVSMSSELKGALIGRTYEIFNNSFQHSDKGVVYSCGEHLRQARRLKLAIVDFGIGIPGSVRPFLKDKYNLPFDPNDVSCMKWAMQPRMTTKPGKGHEGIGLDLLREMVEKNQGKLDIYSHFAHVLVSKEGIQFSRSNTFFGGTLVNISFQCDDRYYRFLHEDNDEPLF